MQHQAFNTRAHCDLTTRLTWECWTERGTTQSLCRLTCQCTL